MALQQLDPERRRKRLVVIAERSVSRGLRLRQTRAARLRVLRRRLAG